MNNPVISKEEWLDARLELLEAEKALTRHKDTVTRQRMAMPWVRVTKPYVFDTREGKKTLAELFDGRSQLIVYHFMLGPDWEQGCKSCSFWADNFNGIPLHLNQRDVTFTAISRAPLGRIEAYRQRMGWSFPWASSHESDFNFDYQVSATPEDQARGQMVYNYQLQPMAMSEIVGISVFARRGQDEVFHTYSCYGRGVEMVNGAYHFLDLVPKGRDEAGLPYPMAWVKRHDEY